MRSTLPAKVATRLLLALGLLSASPAPGGAQAMPQDLARATLEDLLKIRITSASRKEERPDDVPAAVSVITEDDIRRSGITTVPELFRLVPGMTVSQINSNNWAISVRGFGNLTSNKILVLVDGRSIYNLAFSGEFWNSLDLLVEDIDRIEVVHGPGGAMWGANAVNGVINIITKSAADTKGALVRIGAGTRDDGQAAARYGGSIGNLAYRVSSQWSTFGGSSIDSGTAAPDGWNSFTTGFRADWTRDADTVTMEGGLVTGDAHAMWRRVFTPGVAAAVANGASFTRNGTLLGRWTHTRSNGAALKVQSFFDRRRRDDLDVSELEVIADLDVQYHTTLGSRHDVVLGGGHRHNDTRLDGSYTFSLNPPAAKSLISNAFLEDAIAIGNRVHVTLGGKVEHDSVSGWGLVPNARLMWSVVPSSQNLWVAVSRALRTPSGSDVAVTIHYATFTGAQGVPIVLAFLGNPNFQSERFVDSEVGYRLNLGVSTAVDVTAFRGQYSGLLTHEPVAPVFESTPFPPHLLIASKYANLLDADTAGVEIAAHCTPFGTWRIDGSYSAFHLTPHLDPASKDPAAVTFDGGAPAAQYQVHTSVRLGPKAEVTTGLYHVGPLLKTNVPAYTRADARLEFAATKQLSVVATGRNLLERTHRENADPTNPLRSTLVPRTGSVRLVWRF